MTKLNFEGFYMGLLACRTDERLKQVVSDFVSTIDEKIGHKIHMYSICSGLSHAASLTFGWLLLNGKTIDPNIIGACRAGVIGIEINYCYKQRELETDLDRTWKTNVPTIKAQIETNAAKYLGLIQSVLQGNELDLCSKEVKEVLDA
jgi:hypothetical protein